MTIARGDLAAELVSVEQAFPGWSPWVSSAGRCWATRKGSSHPARPPGWWAMTVDADDPQGLREAIAEQEELASRAART